MKSDAKLYVVSRKDLPPGCRAAQLAHGFREFRKAHPDLEEEWYRDSNTIVFLQTDSEYYLSNIITRAGWEGLRIATFCEPDLGGALTAVALEPAAANLLKRLDLAFSELQ